MRQPSVLHSLHPLEQEMGFVLDREHARYCRHQQNSQNPSDAESATAFFSNRGINLDSWNRHDKTAIQRDFFNLDAYREATRVTLERFEPGARTMPADFVDPFADGLAGGPPVRHSVQRRLDEVLLLIVKQAADGKWTVPARKIDRGNGASTAEEGKTSAAFSLRTEVESAILEDHKSGLDAFIFGNAPQGVLQWGAAAPGGGGAPLPRGAPRGETGHQLFVYVASYLVGRPRFDAAVHADHAWVTRKELADYDFAHPDMFSLLQDISIDTGVASSK